MVKQALLILRNHLVNILAPVRTFLRNSKSDVDRVTLVRDIALFTAPFRTAKRRGGSHGYALYSANGDFSCFTPVGYDPAQRSRPHTDEN